MKKIIFLFIFIYLAYFHSFSQLNYFNNVYILNNNHSAGLSITKDDSLIAVASISFDTLSPYRCITFCKYDSLGNLLLKKNFGWGIQNFYPGHQGNFHKISGNNYIISGSVEDIAYVSGFLLKLNSNFDSIFYKKWTDTTYKYIDFQQVNETSDKGFIIAGTISAGSYNHNIYVLKTDSLGNEQWRKIYNLGGIDYARNVLQTPDGGYLLGCYSYNANDYLSGDGRIVKLDSLGNFEWGINIFGPNQDGVPVIAIDKDSNYIVATAHAYETIFGGSSRLKIQVLKLSKFDGAQIWNKQYDTIRNDNLVKMVKVLEDGNILIIGVTDVWDGINYYGVSWLLKLDTNGDSLLYRQFFKYNDSNTIQNSAYDFFVTASNSIVLCGQVSQRNAYDYLWLAKMDSLGCLQPGCQNVGVEELHTAKGNLSIYPNPATTQTTITYTQLNKESRLQFYNMLGQLIYEEKLSKGSSQCIINTTGFKPGLYKVVVGECSETLIIN